MARPVLTKRKADAISNAIFLIALAILFYTDFWWPGILLAIWACVGSRQYLTGRVYDLAITSIILIGLFIVTFFQWQWNVLMPVLLILGGIYIIFREFFYSEDTNGEDKSTEIKHDIEDADK